MKGRSLDPGGFIGTVSAVAGSPSVCREERAAWSLDFASGATTSRCEFRNQLRRHSTCARGSRVELAIENGALVLRPIVRRKRTRVYTIDALLRRMTKENVPPEIDWGEARGHEGW